MKFSRNILCIDDDEDDLEMLHHTFGRIAPHFTIVSARSGEEGISLMESLSAKDQLPCLIILDINMPRMDGRETLTALQSRKEWKQVPVVIFSTSSSVLDKTYFSKMGISYFVKPIDLKDFERVAQQLLRHCRNSNV